jgi:hypothetical protein
MTCDEFQDLAAAFALGILDEPDRRACLVHLESTREHRGCPEAVTEAKMISSKLASTLPHRHPSPQIWNAIEARIGQVLPDAAARRRMWRELAGWFVAAAVLGLYLYGAPLESRKKAVATESSSTVRVQQAMGLMVEPGSRFYPFRPSGQPERQGAAAVRATAIVNLGERRGIVVAANGGAANGLRLWAVRGETPAVALTTLTVAADGVAMAEVEGRAFDAGLPDRLLLSRDQAGATAPQDVALVADLRR